MPQATARTIDENGFMLVRGCHLSREGVYEYAAHQLGLQDRDPMEVVLVYRPDSSVRDEAAIESFKSLPFINEHTMLSGPEGNPEYVAPEEKGIDGVLTDNVYYDEETGWLNGDVKIFGRGMRHDIDNIKDNLSLGFSSSFRRQPGKWKGRDFEFVQFNMRGNHLALVGEGRIDGAKVADSKSFDAVCFDSIDLALTVNQKEQSDMPDPIVNVEGTRDSTALSLLKQLVPQLQAALDAVKAEQVAGDEAVTQEPTQEPEQGAEPTQDPEQGAEPTQDPEQGAEPTKEPVQDAEPGQEPAQPAEKPEDVQVLVSQVEALLAQIKDMAAPSQCQQPTQDEDMSQVAVGDAALRAFYQDNQRRDDLYKRLSNVIGSFDYAVMDSKAMAVYGAKKLGLRSTEASAMNDVENYLSGFAAKSSAVVQNRATMDSADKFDELDKYLGEK